MSSETFEALQRALHHLAEAGPPLEDLADGPMRHVLAAHGLELRYARDERERTLTLLGVSDI
ncbi:hypothetical protein JGU66_08505 [Myxococcaceae bacterium JPH2]|nr:hypothetical protein [Myxococcaceae bacterium JPH2]